MEELDQLRREVARLSLAIRLGLVAVIAGFTVRACITLTRAGEFRVIFADLLGDQPLPAATQFFLAFSTPLTIGLSLLGVAVSVALLAAPKQVWSVPAGILVAAAGIVVSEAAVWAFQAPFLGIVRSLAA